MVSEGRRALWIGSAILSTSQADAMAIYVDPGLWLTSNFEFVWQRIAHHLRTPSRILYTLDGAAGRRLLRLLPRFPARWPRPVQDYAGTSTCTWRTWRTTGTRSGPKSRRFSFGNFLSYFRCQVRLSSQGRVALARGGSGQFAVVTICQPPRWGLIRRTSMQEGLTP